MLERYTDLPISCCLSNNFLCLVDLCLSLIMVYFSLFIQWFHGAFVYWNSLYRKSLLCKCFLILRRIFLGTCHAHNFIRSMFVVLVPNSHRTLCDFCGLGSCSKTPMNMHERQVSCSQQLLSFVQHIMFYQGISLSVECFVVVLHFIIIQRC